jgi:hypothetical protein
LQSFIFSTCLFLLASSPANSVDQYQVRLLYWLHRSEAKIQLQRQQDGLLSKYQTLPESLRATRSCCILSVSGLLKSLFASLHGLFIGDSDQTPAQDGAGRGGLRPLSSRMRPSWLSGPGPHRWRGLHIPQIRAATSERGRWGEKVRERGQASHHLTSLKHGDRQKGQAEACRKLIYTRSGCCACARRAKLLGVVVHRRHREPDAPSVGSRPAPRLSGARLVPQRARDPALELGSTSAREAPEDAGSSDRVGFPRDVGKEVVGRLLRGRVQELSPPLACQLY